MLSDIVDIYGISDNHKATNIRFIIEKCNRLSQYIREWLKKKLSTLTAPSSIKSKSFYTTVPVISNKSAESILTL